MTFKHIGINGIPAVHSKVFIQRSNSINGNIIITHIIAKQIIKAINLKINFILRPIIKSDAAFIAFIGYSPGADTATKAIRELDNKYPEHKTASPKIPFVQPPNIQ